MFEVFGKRRRAKSTFVATALLSKKNGFPTLGAALLALGAGVFAAARAQEPPFISHGPMLGRLATDGVGIWVRTSRPAAFAARYGVAPRRFDQVSAEGRTELARDNTGWLALTDLKPNTRYYYEVFLPGVDDNPGLGGSFRTLPRQEDFVHADLNPRGLFNFSFEFGCGNNQNAGQGVGPALPAFATMLANHGNDIHFAILNGDWMYEAQRSYSRSRWQAQVDIPDEAAPPTVRLAPTICGVWENYKHFLNQGPNLARWHRHVPTFYTYDDHEILNDVWGAGTPGLRDRRAVFRDIGVQAWYDYLGWSNFNPHTQPIRFGQASVEAGSEVLHDHDADFTQLKLEQANNLHVHWGTPTAGVNDNKLDGVGGDPNAGVYEIVKVLDGQHLQTRPAFAKKGLATYSIGRRSYWKTQVANCDFFFLDTRGQREMHDTRDPAKPGLSMLGRPQRDWLLRGVKECRGDFIFVVSSVNFMIPHVGGGAIRSDNKDDAWTVFLDEREKLIEAFDAAPQRVFILTGDLHNSFVINITDNVWEMASGPHNSNNHWASDEGDRPANGLFKSGARTYDIRWSTHFRSDIAREQLLHPTYCVVQLNNVYNNPLKVGDERWIAFPRPQAIFQYYDGRTGKLRYAESVLSATRP